jgi:hypothetical protein
MICSGSTPTGEEWLIRETVRHFVRARVLPEVGDVHTLALGEHITGLAAHR